MQIISININKLFIDLVAMLTKPDNVNNQTIRMPRKEQHQQIQVNQTIHNKLKFNQQPPSSILKLPLQITSEKVKEMQGYQQNHDIISSTESEKADNFTDYEIENENEKSEDDYAMLINESYDKSKNKENEKDKKHYDDDDQKNKNSMDFKERSPKRRKLSLMENSPLRANIIIQETVNIESIIIFHLTFII